MRRGAIVPALALLLLCVAARAAGEDAFGREFDHATRKILCDCGCSPQSVHDCTCGRAEEMRNEIAAEIRQGKSGAQVVDGYVARYGEKILVSPTASGFNLLAWLGPGAALLLGVLGSVLVLRRWKRRSEPVEPADPATPPAEDDPYLARLRAELKEYE